MASRSRPIIPLSLLTIFLLTLGLPAAVLADGDGAEPQERESPSRTYTLGGVTISWDFENQRYHAPTAEQAARISEAFARAMRQGKAEEEIEIKTLPDGTEMARTPAHLFSASVVRVGPAGELVGYCGEPAGQLHDVPAAGAEEEN